MMKYSKSQKGFTLIELLIVIAIIGILAAVILIALAGARQRARDAARKSDVNNIRTALEVYATDNEDYPANLDLLINTTSPSDSYLQGGTTSLEDPSNPPVRYSYYVNTPTNSLYCVGVELEREDDSDGIKFTSGTWFVQGPDCPVDSSGTDPATW